MRAKMRISGSARASPKCSCQFNRGKSLARRQRQHARRVCSPKSESQTLEIASRRLRTNCGKGGSGVRNLGFGEAIRSLPSVSCRGNSRRSRRGANAVLCQQRQILRFVRVDVVLKFRGTCLRAHPIVKHRVIGTQSMALFQNRSLPCLRSPTPPPGRDR